MISYRPIGGGGKIMPTSGVNLDALIKREDYTAIDKEANYSGNGDSPTRVLISEFEAGRVWGRFLRKPIFQRETANWDSVRVAELIESFAKGDLIPAIILWQADNGRVFVIDGAHRLSALLAWIKDDYGDGKTSLGFFQNHIPREQSKAAEKTRKQIKSLVGSYGGLQAAMEYPENSPELASLAKKVFNRSISLQWVPSGSDVEKSYIKINKQAVHIDETELDVIQYRRKPNALATRSLIRAGTGHKYWSTFSAQIQSDIEKIARDIYDTLFEPPIETPLRTPEVPIAGRGYSGESLKTIFELVNLLNNVTPDMWKSKVTTKTKKGQGTATERIQLSDDLDGTQTLRFLKAVKKVVTRIGSNDPDASLGLHPLVYFYGSTGKFLRVAFLAVAAFVKDLETRDAFYKFTKVRSKFEDFLLENHDFVNQISHEIFGNENRVKSTVLMYKILFEGLLNKKPFDDIIVQMKSHTELKFLKETTKENREYSKDFSTETKSAAFLREAIDTPLRCGICNARLPYKAVSFDHKNRKQDGGLGAPENAQLTHPYCNTGYKEKMNAKGIKV